jgi:hypothetical protein
VFLAEKVGLQTLWHLLPLIHSNSGPPRMERWNASQQTQVKNMDNSSLILPTGKIAYIRPDRVCVIGLKEIASIPLLTYDVFLNIFLTGLFVYPLLRRTITNAGLRALAKRTCLYVVIKFLQSFILPFPQCRWHRFGHVRRQHSDPNAPAWPPTRLDLSCIVRHRCTWHIARKDL